MAAGVAASNRNWRRTGLRIVGAGLFIVVGALAARGRPENELYYESRGELIGALFLGAFVAAFFLALVGTVGYGISLWRKSGRTWRQVTFGPAAAAVTLVLLLGSAAGRASEDRRAVENAAPDPSGSPPERVRANQDAARWAESLRPVTKEVNAWADAHQQFMKMLTDVGNTAAGAQLACKCQSLRRVGGQPGVVRPDLPWVAAGVKQRRGDLNARLQTLDKMHRTGDERYDDETHLFVELLRETWERAFEEKVLGGSVTRYEPAIHTQQLAKSAVDGEIVRRIDAGMTETSQWVHDQPRGGHGTVPSPEELKAALGQLDEFLAYLAKRAVSHIQAA